MSDAVERCARDVLRSEAALTIPLSRLHRALVAEAGAAAGTYGQLRERLRCRPERFELVDPPAPPWDDDAWPEDARDAYRAELRRLGAVAEPRLVLRDEPPPEPAPEPGLRPTLLRLDAVLLDLWDAVADAGGDGTPIAEAMGKADELRAAAADVGESRV